MPNYPNWGDDPDRLRTNPSQIAELEARIRAIPPDQRSHYQLIQQGITIPPGYRLEKDGRLKYVAVDNSEHWYNKAEVMIPAILGGGLAAGALAGGGAAAAAGGGIPTTPSYAIGTGMGTGPASLAGTSSIPSAAALIGGSTIPTLASRTIGNGMGTDPSLDGMTNGIGDSVWDSTLGKWVKKAGSAIGTDAANKLTGGASDGIPEWARAAIAAMSGLPALLADKGPSDAENAYADQARRLLAQQEQRTQYQGPLYEAITKMAYQLQPSGGTNGQPYPYNSLNDVKIPGMS